MGPGSTIPELPAAGWRRVVAGLGSLVILALSVLGFVWAWSVVPDAMGLASRVVVVGIIGTIWTVIVAAGIGRLIPRLGSGQPNSLRAHRVGRPRLPS